MSKTSTKCKIFGLWDVWGPAYWILNTSGQADAPLTPSTTECRGVFTAVQSNNRKIGRDQLDWKKRKRGGTVMAAHKRVCTITWWHIWSKHADAVMLAIISVSLKPFLLIKARSRAQQQQGAPFLLGGQDAWAHAKMFCCVTSTMGLWYGISAGKDPLQYPGRTKSCNLTQSLRKFWSVLNAPFHWDFPINQIILVAYLLAF